MNNKRIEMTEVGISSPHLTVDLNALQQNYKELQRVAPKKEICPVVKSNAYGIGSIEVTRALIECGCRNFYVSTVSEGISLRKEFPNIQINVLNGPSVSDIEMFKTFLLTPVINSLKQLEIWETEKSANYSVGCILNLETGFNRLGIKESDWPLITPERLVQNKVSMIMTHLSCAGEDLSDPVNRKQNKRQFDAYQRALTHFKGIPMSLSLDAHLINDDHLPITQIRSGAALLGINVFPKKLNLSPVLTIEAPVLQVETISKGDAVGYGATFRAMKDTKIAVLGIGYGHGIPRSLSNVGKVWFQDGDHFYEAPIVGRISMGLLNCDVTNVPQSALRANQASLINKRYTINDLYTDSGRLDTEVLCCLNSMSVDYMNERRREVCLGINKNSKNSREI